MFKLGDNVTVARSLNYLGKPDSSIEILLGLRGRIINIFNSSLYHINQEGVAVEFDINILTKYHINQEGVAVEFDINILTKRQAVCLDKGFGNNKECIYGMFRVSELELTNSIPEWEI